jgi:hypothetical protein
MHNDRATFSGLAAVLFLGLTAWAQAPEADFHKAYFLEVEEGKIEEAIKVYEGVAKAKDAPAGLVERARKRLASCLGEVRARDLARLMPPDALAYVEVQHPGKHLAKILGFLGLTGPGGQAAGPQDERELPLVSPRLLEALETVEGAALAVTDINPRGGIPEGVLAIHSGRSDLLQGLIETALSGGAVSNALRAVEPVEGHRAFESPFGTVVVTERLVLAGNPPAAVVDAIHRLERDDEPSLLRSREFEEGGAGRGDGLIFAYVNARRALEKAKAEMSRGGELPPEYQLAQALGDIESLRWAALRLGTEKGGISGGLRLRLADGNHALPYHLLRTPPLGKEALKAVPSGPAIVLGLALSETQGATSAPDDSKSQAAKYVTGLDLGREIFNNVNDALLFALPGGAEALDRGSPGALVPGAGIVLLVKDPSKSKVLLGEILRILELSTKENVTRLPPEVLEGHEVQVCTLPHSMDLYLATLKDRVILATSRLAISQAMKAADGGASLSQDAAFADALEKLPKEASKVLLLHAGRAWEIARAFGGPKGPEAAQIQALLEKTTASVVTVETPTSLELSFLIDVPKLGGMIRQLVFEREGVQPSSSPRAEASQGSPATPARSGKARRKKFEN